MHRADQIVQVLLWTYLIFVTSTDATLVSSNDLMKCSYGERGSLTATCVRANPAFFRTTPYRFDQLDETLKCLNCTLKSIESNSFDISGNMIKNLILQHSEIESMKPKAFIGLIFLENLDLSYNEIRSIYPGTFQGIKKIKRIDLSYNKINILSDNGFLELVDLEELIFKRNNIGTIASKAFNGLDKLRILKLAHNVISDITCVFNNLTSLEVLDLENNQISLLKGSEFENLTSLLELNLAGNKIQEPNLQIVPKNKLRFLSLNSNVIKDIKPEYFNSLHNLENLDLSYNHIQSVNHKELQSLDALRYLNLSSNRLTIIFTGAFSGLPQLALLNVSNNQISDIAVTGVFSLHSLHYLDVSHNRLRDLDYVGLISRLPKLTYLKLENNLLPCDLEGEMQEYFAEDNFKFELFSSQVGSVKCIDEPVKRRKQVAESLVQEVSPERSVSGLEITIIIFMCIVVLSVGHLYYLQFRTFQNLKGTPAPRTVSSLNLVTDGDTRGVEDFA